MDGAMFVRLNCRMKGMRKGSVYRDRVAAQHGLYSEIAPQHLLCVIKNNNFTLTFS